MTTAAPTTTSPTSTTSTKGTTATTGTTGTTPTGPGIDPAPILEVASGFMAAKHLFAASELGLFEALADAPASLSALADRTGLTRRAARISADAMVALGLLERDGELYHNGAVADAFLAGRGPADLRPLLRHWDRNSYPAWADFAGALGRGPRQQYLDLDERAQAVAAAGIEAILAGPAAALPQVVDLSSRRRLLDVGGGTGSWSRAAVSAYEGLTATVAELPIVAGIARRRIEEAGLADRMSVIACDVLAEPLPGGCDAFLVANVVHLFSPDTNRQLLRAVHAAAEPGAVLMLADFWTDATHTRPLAAAIMAGEFAVHLYEGDVYSVDEVASWLDATGWRLLSHQPLAGPQSVITAERT